ncbi:MAG TPA: hypothetical protein VI757_11325 [Bacteroidia bacterium]|nr:hypothetical protein [Bacteroidia bacterium]
MISYVENKNIDRGRWDKTIAASANGLVFAYSWFLDTVSERWDALIEDDYKYIFPLPRKSKFGFRYIHQPVFTNQLGIFSAEPISSEKVNSFLENIPSAFRHVELGLNFSNTLYGNYFCITALAAQHIDLSGGYESIGQGYSDNLKRNLRKAEASGMKIILNVSPESVTEYFRKAKGDALKIYDDNDYRTLTKLIKLLIEKQQGFTAGVYAPDNSMIAAAGFMFSNNRIFYLKGAANAHGREINAMHFLMDNIFRQQAGKKMYFDFGGSVIPSLARFYKSFGAQDYFYQHVKMNRLPFYLRWLKK